MVKKSFIMIEYLSLNVIVKEEGFWEDFGGSADSSTLHGFMHQPAQRLLHKQSVRNLNILQPMKLHWYATNETTSECQVAIAAHCYKSNTA